MDQIRSQARKMGIDPVKMKSPDEATFGRQKTGRLAAPYSEFPRMAGNGPLQEFLDGVTPQFDHSTVALIGESCALADEVVLP